MTYIKNNYFEGDKIMDDRRFNEILKLKQRTLTKIMHSPNPTNPNMQKRHDERVSNAAKFYDELNQLHIETDLDILLVSDEDSLYNAIKNAEYSDIKVGKFHKFAYMYEYPPGPSYVVWIESLAKL